MTSNQLPRLLFFGAGNIAQSMMRGILRTKPGAEKQILATAPSTRNLQVIEEKLGCKTSLLASLSPDQLFEFNPDYVFLCMKPQSFVASIEHKQQDHLYKLLHSIPKGCKIFSLIAGLKAESQSKALDFPEKTIMRLMFNTAAELNSTSVFYYSHMQMSSSQKEEIESFFRLIGHPVIMLSNENLMDVATGLCGSGIAFFYEVIQVFSDMGVKNGLTRKDSMRVAAQLAKAAGEMVLNTGTHPYQLRDDVSSPSGTTIYGLARWHEQGTNQNITNSIQASIDRSRDLSNLHPSK